MAFPAFPERGDGEAIPTKNEDLDIDMVQTVRHTAAPRELRAAMVRCEQPDTVLTMHLHPAK